MRRACVLLQIENALSFCSAEKLLPGAWNIHRTTRRNRVKTLCFMGNLCTSRFQGTGMFPGVAVGILSRHPSPESLAGEDSPEHQGVFLGCGIAAGWGIPARSKPRFPSCTGLMCSANSGISLEFRQGEASEADFLMLEPLRQTLRRLSVPQFPHL